MGAFSLIVVINLLNRCRMTFLRLVLQQVEEAVFRSIIPFANPALAIAGQNHCDRNNFLDDIWEALRDPFMLMAAPKGRRSLATVRRRRRHPFRLIPKRPDLEPCAVCGNTKIKFYLCSVCYRRIMLETKEIQAKMAKAYMNPLKAIKNDVVLLYDELEGTTTDKNIKKSESDKPKRKILQPFSEKKTTEDESSKHVQTKRASKQEELVDCKIPLRISKPKPSWFF